MAQDEREEKLKEYGKKLDRVEKRRRKLIKKQARLRGMVMGLNPGARRGRVAKSLAQVNKQVVDLGEYKQHLLEKLKYWKG